MGRHLSRSPRLHQSRPASDFSQNNLLRELLRNSRLRHISDHRRQRRLFHLLPHRRHGIAILHRCPHPLRSRSRRRNFSRQHFQFLLRLRHRRPVDVHSSISTFSPYFPARSFSPRPRPALFAHNGPHRPRAPRKIQTHRNQFPRSVAARFISRHRSHRLGPRQRTLRLPNDLCRHRGTRCGRHRRGHHLRRQFPPLLHSHP